MSMKGTPWYDMALDAGMRGEEAEQMAQMIAAEAEAEYEAARQAEHEQQMAEEEAAAQEDA